MVNTYEGLLQEISAKITLQIADTTAIKTELGTMDTAIGILKDDVALIKPEIVSMDTAIGTLKDDVALIKPAILTASNKLVTGAPTGGTPVQPFNATPVAAAATAQTIVAAPAASNHYEINALIMSNTTAADVAILQLEDEDDNILAGPFTVGDPAVNGKGALTIIFPQPIIVPSVKGLQVACIGDVGDSTMHVFGYSIAD